jgi:hypothetical protein
MLLASNALVDFFAMNNDIFWRIDADAYLVTLHADDGHGNVVADPHRLTHLSRQYQHGWSLALEGYQWIQTGESDFPETSSLRPASSAAVIVDTKEV